MSQRADEIRKRIANRQREKKQYSSHQSPRSENPVPNYFARDEERHGVAPFDSYEGGLNTNSHPLFKKEWLMFKILGAACLLLVVAIMYKDGSARLEPAREFVTKTMENDFQFAAVTTWYEGQFGKPLALLPVSLQKETAETSKQYAVPASGMKILENFEKNGQGIMVETASNSAVEAINGGYVNSIGQEDGIGGITVKVQHSDGTESWYGNLGDTEVLLYQFIEKGTEIGKSSQASDGVNGTFYFAIKKDDSFIDPIQVINIE
ncbi:peptidoglycan DD-metalloendopeptidase family protein [Bacillus sp. DJP31]|uniref:peptidoglycan DD-metalloendopeptidase family protein n=1 Tax=Bacillus sp. DJP31 TaxID=3409789 RepID=UPI003BB78409